ncbi:MAG: hypothetical protein QM485_03430 [Flavobacteriaceae bacterium]
MLTNNLRLSTKEHRVFLNLWKKKIEFEDKKTVRAYMYSAVKNKSLDYLKSNSSRKKSKLSIDDLKTMGKDTFSIGRLLFTKLPRLLTLQSGHYL